MDMEMNANLNWAHFFDKKFWQKVCVRVGSVQIFGQSYKALDDIT